MIIDAFAGNIFNLVDSVTSNIKVQSVRSNLALQSVARSNVILQSVDNSFVLRDVPTVNRSITVGHFADALNLSSTPVTGPGTLTVASTFFFWQKIVNTGFVNASNHLNLSQQIDAVAGPVARSLLTLTQSVSVTTVHVVNTSNVLTLQSQQAAFKPIICFANGQDPILHNKNPYFAYQNMKVVLRSPDFGNVERISQNRIMRRSRAGDLIIFRDNNWPATETLQMQFMFIDRATAAQLLDFMRQTIGLKVIFYDNEQRTWRGYIMTPAAQVAEQLENAFTVSLEFQGTQAPLHVQNVSQSLTLTGSGSVNGLYLLGDPESNLNLTQSIRCFKPQQRLTQTLALKFGGGAQNFDTTPPIELNAPVAFVGGTGGLGVLDSPEE